MADSTLRAFEAWRPDDPPLPSALELLLGCIAAAPGSRARLLGLARTFPEPALRGLVLMEMATRAPDDVELHEHLLTSSRIAGQPESCQVINALARMSVGDRQTDCAAIVDVVRAASRTSDGGRLSSCAESAFDPGARCAPELFSLLRSLPVEHVPTDAQVRELREQCGAAKVPPDVRAWAVALACRLETSADASPRDVERGRALRRACEDPKRRVRCR